jgi:anaerobic dimethyl sulfoxide reductase subunit B (iron-sulfur subunit)
MVQYGFYFDEGRCNGCHSCAIACKVWRGIAPGPQKPLRILKWEKGTWPNVSRRVLFAPCYHCENPVCVDVANGALIKEPKYGAVLIDPYKATSPDLRAAAAACPYGAIAFDSNSPNATACMCNLCVDKLENGEMPVCVMSCPMRALDFGKIDDLRAKYGANNRLESMPDPSIVKPSIVFKPTDAIPKKKLIPYDANKAIQLFANRPSGLSPNYSSPSDVTQIPEGLVRRNKLMLKTSGIEEFMYYTRDEGEG